jgi:hypothetical protein
MSEQSAYEAIELRLARTGTDLWSAVEAAQYARFIHHDEPESEADARAILRFVEAFSACTEAWERTPLESKAGALAGLGAQLEALGRHGLFVHWATVERNLAPQGRAPLTMPVAILAVTGTSLPTVTAKVPREIAGVSA